MRQLAILVYTQVTNNFQSQFLFLQGGNRRSDLSCKPVTTITSSVHSMHSPSMFTSSPHGSGHSNFSSNAPSVRRSSRLFTLSSSNTTVSSFDSSNKVSYFLFTLSVTPLYSHLVITGPFLAWTKARSISYLKTPLIQPLPFGVHNLYFL